MNFVKLLFLLGASEAAKFQLTKHENNQLDFGQRFLAGEKIDIVNQQLYKSFAQYSVEVDIGTPPQKFNMIPDITQPWTFVYNHKCWSLPCFYRPLYDHTKSTSYKEVKIPNIPAAITVAFPFTVPGSAVTVSLSQDVVQLGDLKTNFMFGEATHLSGNAFAESNVSGVIGLGYSNTTASHLPSFWEAMNLTSSSYSFYLNDNKENNYMTVPGMDTDNYEPIKEHHIVDKSKFYEYNLNFDHFKTKNDRIIKNENNISIMLSVGYPMIAMPDTIAYDLLDSIYVEHDCSNIASLPPITLTIDRQDYTLQGKDYVMHDEGICKIAFQTATNPFGSPYQHIILGEPFLKAFPAMFDQDKDTVTFQKRKTTESKSEQLIQ